MRRQHCVILGIATSILAIVLSNNAGAEVPSDVGLKHYEQWRLAAEGIVADPDSIEAPPGFKVEMIRAAMPGESSWVSLAFDPQGRIVIAKEETGLLRLTLDDDGTTVARTETIDDTQKECRGLLFAHGWLYAMANNSKQLVRLCDVDDDGKFETTEVLKELPGEVGHGRNSLALGPDDKIYLACGNNVRIPADYGKAHSPYVRYGLDRLLPCAWNEFLFDANMKPPAGFISRCDKDGRDWQLFAAGFRNPYGLAFNDDGELFTYDADMEWDVGAPWYRATRVMHVVSGGEYGWRQGTSVWPDQFADMLPGVVDIGLGSPTGVLFGSRSRFPDAYRESMFVLDWAYGRILAVRLTPKGATYTGRAEPFVKGRPLNVTAAKFGPDGAMYFTVGGRKTQGALYRVRYIGDHATAAAPKADATAYQARLERRSIEQFHGVPTSTALDDVWPKLGSHDHWIASAARVAVEHQPVESWQHRTLKEHDAAIAAMACLALARCGSTDLRPQLLERLETLLSGKVSNDIRLVLLRALQLALIRMPVESSETPSSLTAALDGMFPSQHWSENELLCELLVYFNVPSVISKSLDLLDSAGTQEQQVFYLYTLRNLREGWKLDDRRRYFTWLKRAEKFRGAHYIARFVTFIRTDAFATLSDQERASLASTLATLGKSDAPLATITNRPLVHAWTSEELTAMLSEVGHGRDYAHGRAMFAEALCIRCHRFGDTGIAIGPDLAAIATRFSRRDILESVLKPSKVVEEKYRTTVIETNDGRIVIGQIAGGDANAIALAVDPFEPSSIERVKRSSIERRTLSRASIMPEGLLNTLARDEILDLLAFLESAGDPTHPDFALECGSRGWSLFGFVA